MDQKYIKYKQKYLDLKYKQNGGSEWFRYNPETKQWQELAKVNRGIDTDIINSTVEFVRNLQGTRDLISEYSTDLPSGRTLKLTFKYHPDGNNITKYEYIGSRTICPLSNKLNKNRDFLYLVLTGRQMNEGIASFTSKKDAIEYVTTNFDSNIELFNRYKIKPTLPQIIEYINSLSEEHLKSFTS